MDFSKLLKPSTGKRPVDPIEIFGKLPHLPHTPNDLWRGQTEALKEWHASRASKDVLISLNTGAGKTLVGLLIAQSLVNEGLDNVLYVCSTNDLVMQTEQEATKLGLRCTTRMQGKFSNDLFERGETFCITNYAAAFNALSLFNKRHFPDAVIFDDAHVAEKAMRDCFTLRIKDGENQELCRDLIRLFEPAFKDLLKAASFNDAWSGISNQTLMAPPGYAFQISEQLRSIFKKHRIVDNIAHKLPYLYLADNIAHCAFLFSKGTIEITPPFLPVLSLPIFGDEKVRRIYLSATLKHKSDLIRAFGHEPATIVEPQNDAGNGERLVLFASDFKGGNVNSFIVKEILAKNKVLLSVPSYKGAEKWGEFGAPPSAAEFSQALAKFKAAKHGLFVLVSRVDGIDLPHETCRVMIIDELPASASMIEAFQWEILMMRTFYGAKMANRITQLFGRINRGRNDYGVFIVNGPSINNWLRNKKNIALLPELLRKQLILGQSVQDQQGIKETTKIVDVIDTVLGRDENWVRFYTDSINEMDLDDETIETALEAEDVLSAAALSEVKFMSAVWDNDLANGRTALEATVENVGRVDPKLAGWHNVWLGACFEWEGDREAAALDYGRARKRLGRMISLPRYKNATSSNASESQSPVADKAFQLVSIASADRFNKELRTLQAVFADLNDGIPHKRQEEAIRLLGEAIGYDSSRPCNDEDTGPDVLWCDEEKKVCIGFELKTEKKAPATYSKQDIAQGHDHLNWIEVNRQGYKCLGLVFVGPEGRCSDNANPSPQMYLCQLARFRELAERYLAAIEDLRKVPPNARHEATEKVFPQDGWDLGSLFKLFGKQDMASLKK